MATNEYVYRITNTLEIVEELEILADSTDEAQEIAQDRASQIDVAVDTAVVVLARLGVENVLIQDDVELVDWTDDTTEDSEEDEPTEVVEREYVLDLTSPAPVRVKTLDELAAQNQPVAPPFRYRPVLLDFTLLQR